MFLWDTSSPSSPSAGFLNWVSIPCLNNSSLYLLACCAVSSVSWGSVTLSLCSKWENRKELAGIPTNSSSPMLNVFCSVFVHSHFIPFHKTSFQEYLLHCVLCPICWVGAKGKEDLSGRMAWVGEENLCSWPQHRHLESMPGMTVTKKQGLKTLLKWDFSQDGRCWVDRCCSGCLLSVHPSLDINTLIFI